MLSRLYGVLLPFFVSFLIAYLLDPVVNFVQNKCKVKIRGLAVTIVLLVFIALFSLSVYLLIPAIGREVRSAAVGVEQYFANFDADKYFTPEQQDKIQKTLDGLNMESLLSYPEVHDAVKSLVPKVAGWITGGLSWLAKLVFEIDSDDFDYLQIHTGINRFCIKYNVAQKAEQAYSLVKEVLFTHMRELRPLTLRMTHAELAGVTSLDFMIEHIDHSPLNDAARESLRVQVKQLIEEPTTRGFRVKLLL